MSPAHACGKYVVRRRQAKLVRGAITHATAMGEAACSARSPGISLSSGRRAKAERRDGHGWAVSPRLTRGQEPIHRHVSVYNVLKRGSCDTRMQKVSRKRQESMRAHVLHIDCMAPGLHKHNVTCARLRQICRAAASGEARTWCHYARYGHGRGRMQCQEPWNIFEQRPTRQGGEARRPWVGGKSAPTALKHALTVRGTPRISMYIACT